jgi:flagellar hook assembly protein FlgD
MKALWDYFTIIKSDTVNTGFRTHELTPENCQIISYPNPFRSSTDIFYSLSQQGYVKIEIYNLLGQRLATLVNEIKNKGEYTVKWNAEDEKGNKIPGGVYIAQIQMGKVSKSIRMILLQ